MTEIDDLNHSGTQPSDAFGEEPTNALPREARVALATLLTQRFITRTKHRSAWEALLAYRGEVEERLADLFLTLEVDPALEVAFKRQSGEDGVPVLLRQAKPLSRDASFVLIFLRQEHSYADAQDDSVLVTRDQIAELLSRQASDKRKDPVALARDVNAAIKVVEDLGLLDEDPDVPDVYVVSPAVVPLITTDVVGRFLSVYDEAAASASARPGSTEEPEVTIDDD